MTHAQVAREVSFRQQSIRITEIDRIQVMNDFSASKPDIEAMCRVLGYLSAHVTDFVMRKAYEEGPYPGRLDFDAALREAYKPRLCDALFADAADQWGQECGGTLEPSAHWQETLCPKCRESK